MAALIFDMDGVIVDSTAMHMEAWKAYLAKWGIVAEDLAARMLGKHNSQLVRDFFPPDALTSEVIYSHGAQKEQIYREMMGPVLSEKLVPGVREFVIAQSTHPLAVATNAEPANVDFILESTGLKPYFRAVVNGDHVPRPKPFPDIFLRAADMLGYDPEDCVVFEDSPTGIQAATAAGMRVVGVSTSVSGFNDVDLTIRDFLDPRLESWLQELRVSR